MKRTKRIKYIIAFMLVALLFIAISFNAAGASAPFEIHLLDVGQGLSVLIKADDEYLLYDGGGRESSSFVVSYLKQQGIEKLEYLIASHYDEDHISGLIGALHVFQCKTILEPDYSTDTDIYKSYRNTSESLDAEILIPEAGQEFSFGEEGSIRVLGPETYQNEEENDRSVAIRVVYKNMSILLCGDAQETEESQILSSGEELQSTCYVVDHHGSAQSSTASFLNQVNPQYALISSKKGNSYGHPAESTMQRFSDLSCHIFRTDQQGSIVIYSDGDDIWYSQDPCDDYSPGEIEKENETIYQEEKSESEDEGLGYTYICNKNSKKFHRPECKSVDDMKEKNKLYTSEGRDTLIEEGYTPCKNCNP